MICSKYYNTGRYRSCTLLLFLFLYIHHLKLLLQRSVINLCKNHNISFVNNRVKYLSTVVIIYTAPMMRCMCFNFLFNSNSDYSIITVINCSFISIQNNSERWNIFYNPQFWEERYFTTYSLLSRYYTTSEIGSKL